MTDVTLTIRRLGALDGRSPCAPPMRWRHPRKPMARIYRRRGAATFVNAARDRVDCEHGGNTLQERIALLDRNQASRVP
jgi:hypothetical protein